MKYGIQSDGEFDINACFDDDSILDRTFYIKNARVRFKTLTIIENLPFINTYIPEYLLSRLPIRDSSILSSLTSSSGKFVGRRKGGRNKSTVDKIKNLLTDCGL